jgi:hypothetical protein
VVASLTVICTIGFTPKEGSVFVSLLRTDDASRDGAADHRHQLPTVQVFQ